MKVVAFGFETFVTGLGDGLYIDSRDGYDMIHHRFDGYEAFQDADIIIFDPGCFDECNDYLDPDELRDYKESRAREIYRCLCDGATVCVLVGSLPSTPSNLVKDIELKRDKPHYRLLRDVGIAIEPFESPVTALKVKRSEFDSFLREYGTATKSFEKDDGTFEFEICVAERWPDIVTGFATRVKKGLLVCLPCLPRERRFGPYVEEMLKALAPGLVTFSKKALLQPPPWLAELHLTPELPILERRNQASSVVFTCDEQLARYEPFKRILYLSDDELAHAVPQVLETIGFDEAHGFVVEDTSASELEDFRISHTTDALLLIGEVKHSTRNVKSMHMSKLDAHRKARGLDSNFPALCIVNTFLGARSLQEKNTRVEPRECRIARNMTVTVMRTLDLFWLLNDMLSLDPGLRDVDKFLALLRKGGGWLEWTKEGATLHPA